MNTRATSGSGDGMGCLLALVIAAVVVSVTSIILTSILTVAIWPGEMKLLAPLLCTDEQPTPFVVFDTYNPRPGETVTTFSFYCVGPRGDFTDHGYMGPMMMLTALHALAVSALVALVIVPRLLARRSSRRDLGSGPLNDDPPSSSPTRTAPQNPIVSGAIDDDPNSNIVV